MVGIVASLFGASPAYAYVNFDTLSNTTDLNGNAVNGVTTVEQSGAPIDANAAILNASSYYVGVPGTGPQTINTDVASFNGGVVLGLATFFPAITFASSPNVYGTADFGNGLSHTLSIAMNGGATTKEVSFALFNGETFNQSYQITAYGTDGTSVIGTQIVQNIVPNWQSGYSIVDLKFLSNPNDAANSTLLDFTSVKINAINSSNQAIDKPGLFDFLIDDVAFGSNIASILDPSAPVNVSSPDPTVKPTVLYLPPPSPPSTPDLTSPPSIVESQTPTTVCRGQGNSRKCVQATVDSVVDYGDNANNRKGNKTQFTKVDDSNEILDVQEFAEPVPEPESYAMILAGFGVMGFVARRRRTIS
jgi:hypothetical protein